MWFGPNNTFCYDVNYVSGWCAGIHVGGLTNTSVQYAKLDDIFDLVAQEEGSVVCVTTNVDETDVIAWLRKHKFSKGRNFKNYNHDGRKTCMWFKQVPKSVYDKYNDQYDW